MDTLDRLQSPSRYLPAAAMDSPGRAVLEASERWWCETGLAVSQSVDRAGGARLQAHDRIGMPIDRVAWPAGHELLQRRGIADGIVALARESGSLLPGYRLGYLTSFYDPGVYCPHTLSLATLLALDKHGDGECRAMADRLSLRGAEAWQGATWMTEAGGGSDLGGGVETVARPSGDRWRLDGEKHFASNADADVALVAARPLGADPGPRGLGLFTVPRYRADGRLNYRIRRLKDKIATRSVATGEIGLEGTEALRLDGGDVPGIYLIMEVLNVSRVANSVASVALVQRALAEAAAFARERRVFGRLLIEQPLFRHEFDRGLARLREASALAWAAAHELDAVRDEHPPYSPRFHRFRLLAHLAKYWTAELAVQYGRWAVEAHGGNGLIADYGVERLLREAQVLAVWEGTPHRQMLDGLAVMRRAKAHEALFAWLGEAEGTADRRREIEWLLSLPDSEGEAAVEAPFAALARWTGSTLAEQGMPGDPARQEPLPGA